MQRLQDLIQVAHIISPMHGKDLFQPKDHLNGRFFHKRAFYLAVVAQSLSSSPKLSLQVMYDSPQADSRRTCLAIRTEPTNSSSDFTSLNATIRIHLTLRPEASPISISRLSPSHSNLRFASESSFPSSPPPTPLYNNTLLQNFTSTTHMLATYHHKSDIPSFADALSLLRVWANQRGYMNKGERVVRGFEVVPGAWWGFLIATVVYGVDHSIAGPKLGPKRRPLGKGLSSYQLFRGVMDYLGEPDRIIKGCRPTGLTKPFSKPRFRS